MTNIQFERAGQLLAQIKNLLQIRAQLDKAAEWEESAFLNVRGVQMEVELPKELQDRLYGEVSNLLAEAQIKFDML